MRIGRHKSIHCCGRQPFHLDLDRTLVLLLLLDQWPSLRPIGAIIIIAFDPCLGHSTVLLLFSLSSAPHLELIALCLVLSVVADVAFTTC